MEPFPATFVIATFLVATFLVTAFQVTAFLVVTYLAIACQVASEGPIPYPGCMQALPCLDPWLDCRQGRHLADHHGEVAYLGLVEASYHLH